MKKLFPLILSGFIITSTYAQMGVGTTTPTSTLDVRGSLATNYISFTTATTAAITDNTLVFTGSLAATLTLPNATTCTGRSYWIKNASSNASVLTVSTTAAQTIDGLASWVISQTNRTIRVFSNGANWYVASESSPGTGAGSSWILGGNSVSSAQNFGTTSNFDLPFITNNTERIRLTAAGKIGVGTAVPTALLHIKAGTAVANTAPLKFTSGALLTTAEAGAFEFLTDKYYGTITTGAVRKEFTLNETLLTSARVPFANASGRLTDLAAFTYVTNRLSPTYITLGAGIAAAGGAPLVFTSGVSLTTPIAGAMEFTTDNPTFTITTGLARKQFTLNDAALTPGGIPVISTNGRLISNANFVYDNTNSRLGVRAATPTAYLHLGAGTATLNTAPLKFTAGTLLTTAEAGAVEFDGTHFYATVNSTRYQLDQQSGNTYTGSNGITLVGTDFRNNLITGIAGGQTVIGGTAAGNSLTLSSTSHATKGNIIFGSSAYDEVNNRLGLGNSVPTEVLDVTGNLKFSGALMPNNLAGSAGNFLTSNGAGAAPSWSNVTASAWGLTGNSGTSSATNFLGTTDAQDMVFKANNIERMRIVNGVSATTGTTGDITIGDATSGTLRSAKELVMRQDGDAYGPSTLHLRNRNGENGAIFETIGASAYLVDFIFRTGAAASPISTNIRFETRASSEKVTGNTTEWQFGQPDVVNGGPTLVIGASGTGSNSAITIGNFGIGTTNPSQKLDVSGSVKFSGALMPNNLAGTAGTFLTSTGAGTAPTWVTFDTANIPAFSQKVRSLFSATAPITYSNGLIGITQATTTTNGYLSSTDWNTFNNKANTASTWAVLGNASTNSGINFLGTSDNASLKFRTNNIQRMRIDSTGNVAIGQDTFDPTNPEMLVVNAGVTSSVNAFLAKGSINNYFQINVKNSSTGINATSDVVATADNGTETTNYVDFGINGSNYAGGAIETGTSNDGYIISSGKDFYVVNSSANKSMLFLTGGTGIANERMRILANGRVGMGVQDPTAPFVVKDTMEIRRVGPLSQLLFSNTAGSGDFRIGGDGGDIFWQGGGGRGLQMGSYWGTVLTGDRQTTVYPSFLSTPSGTGVLVLGTRDASVPLGVQANSGTQSANLTEWRNSSGTVLSAISKDGYLGISNAAPGEKLDVSGNIKFSGALMPNNLAGTAGTFLTSAGAGSAPTWTTFDTTNIPSFSQKVRSLLSATAPITYSNGLIGITQATTSANGYLSSTDWNTFNNKAGTANTWSTSGNSVASAQMIGTTTNFDFPFITNNTEKMRLSAGGNLGIGASVVDGTNAEKLLVDAGTNSYNVISGKGNLNSYLQLNIKNINTGTNASSDVVATNDAGTEANGLNFVDMGVNSSGNTSTGVLGGASTAYLYSTGNDFSIGNATAGKNLLLFTGGTATTNERMRIDGSGNVGIGTTTPAQKLDVNGNINAQGSVYLDAGTTNTGTATPGLVFGGSGSGEAISSKRTSGTNQYGIDFYTASASRMTITNSGNVGMGTTTPSQKLDVAGNVKFSGALMPSNLAGNSGDFLVSTGSGAAPIWFNATPFVSTVAWVKAGNAGTASATDFIGTTDYKSFKIKTNNNQGFILDSLGSVGIGTSPTFTSGAYREKFLVDAGTTTSYNPLVVQGTIDSFFQFNIQNFSGGTHASSDIVATSNSGSQTSYFVDMGINGSGNTSNIYGKSNDAYLYNQGENFFIGASTPAKSLIFMTGGTDSATNEHMHIDGNGNVGIGTGAPNSNLDVNGSVGHSIVTTTTNLTLNSSNYTVIVTGLTPTITLPAASTCNRRIYVIVNETGSNLNLSGSYIGFNAGSSTIVSGTSSITIQSNGTSWYRIQ